MDSKRRQRCVTTSKGARAEHSKMNNTRMPSEPDPDEHLYIMDSCRDRLNACDPLKGPTDRQHEDILLQVPPPESEAIRLAHLKRGDFGLDDIRRMIAAIYADNLARSRSESLRGIVGRGATMPAMIQDRNDIKCHLCGRVGHCKVKCLLRVKQQQKNGGQLPQQREEQQNNPSRQHQQHRGGGRGLVWCSYHKITSHSDAYRRARRRKRVDGNAHIAANRAFADKGNLQRPRFSRRGRSAGTPLHLLHSDGGTSHGGNCRGAKSQWGNMAI